MKVKLIVALFLIPILIPAISAQFEVPEWELGWDTNMETTYELQLDVDDWDLEEILVLYVDNERNSEVNLELTIEISDEVKEGSIGFYPNFWKGYISQVRGHKVVEYITEGYEE